MSILSKVTWKTMWKNKTRTMVTIGGVILAAALFMAVTTAVYTAWDFMIRGAASERGDFFVQIEGVTGEGCKEVLEDPTVDYAADFQLLGYYCCDRESTLGSYSVAAVDAVFLEHMSLPLAEGRMPENSSEIVLSSFFSTAKGSSIGLGDTVTLPLNAQPGGGDTICERTYTVVGFQRMDIPYSIDTIQPPYRSFFTVADGGQGEILYHRLFVKTKLPYMAYPLAAKGHGEASFINQSMLDLYGMTQFVDRNEMILLLVLILVAIVMAVTVSLIGNAFSISVSERTQQFGLLSSVGTTRKQIRQSVRFEAFTVGMIGIPIGLLLGYGGIAILFRQFGSQLDGLFLFSESGLVTIETKFSWIAAVAAVLICGITIRFSAWIPARRATRVTPLEAIRENREYQPVVRTLRVGKLTGKLFGIPGVMARKYYKVSRRKYRSTVISLTISLTLFVVAGQYCTGLTMMSDAAAVENFDFEVRVDGEDRDAVFEQLRSDPDVSRSALTLEYSASAVLHGDDLTDTYREATGFVSEGFGQMGVTVVYLEDSVLQGSLMDVGVDPAPYFDQEPPLAVMLELDYTVSRREANEEVVQYPYHEAPLKRTVSQLMLSPTSLPADLMGGSFLQLEATEDGEPVAVTYETVLLEGGQYAIDETSKVYYLIDVTDEKDGYKTVCDHYRYDPETGERSTEPAATESVFLPEVTIGTCLDQHPFGISTERGRDITVILPLSEAPQELAATGKLSLKLKADSYASVHEMLSAMEEEVPGFSYVDYAASQQDLRGRAAFLRIGAVGFIALICLICMANVFNTISTNIALRRRDFGMLRSVGFKNRELYRMMAFECLSYGSRALLWGIPLSILLALACQRVFGLVYRMAYAIPWGWLALGACAIFLVVFATASYSLFKLRRDDPVDAVRM